MAISIIQRSGEAQFQALISTADQRLDKLHAAIVNPWFDISKLTRPELYLDGPTLERHFSALNKSIGAVPSYAGSRFSQIVARRMATRLGRQFEEKLQVPAATLSTAWYFPIWCELCTLIPIRHLARRVAKIAAGDPVLVPITERRGRYLSYWHRNSLEALFMVSELKRAGAVAILVFRRLAQNFSDKFIYRFEPHSFWPKVKSNRNNVRRDSSTKNSSKNVVVLSGIRGHKQVLSEISDSLIVYAGLSPSRPSPQETLFRTMVDLPTVELNFTRRSQNGLLRGSLQHFCCDLPYHSYSDWLLHTIGALTKSAHDEAVKLVADYGVNRAHVCDHLFFESSLIAQAVKSSGGNIILWPHSSNSVHVDVRRSIARPDHVYCITKTHKDTWTSSLESTQISIRSNIMLKPCAKPRSLTPGAPITVVVIAGAYNLNRMPLLDVEGHRESYRSLFSGLLAMEPDVQLLCKAKGNFESMEWLKSLAPTKTVLKEVLEHPTKIDFPNMIFVTVSYGSSALLEGLGRGIPGMVVREISVEDYTAIDSRNVPIGSTHRILTEIRKCQDMVYFSDIIKKQLDWYKSQTHFVEA